MSYPYPQGHESHPYPPSMSYPLTPSAPNGPGAVYPPPAQGTPYSASSVYPALPTQGNVPATPYPLAGMPNTSPTPYNAGYPPAANTTPVAYPPSQPGYTGPVPGYPPNSGYPSPGYPPNPAYPPTSAYPPNPGYPPSSAYPPSPAYPSAGYPATPVHTHSSQQNAGHYPHPHTHSHSHPQHVISQGHHQQGHVHNKGNPTVRPASPFNPKVDAELLRKAMRGFGTDEAAIISILSRRTNAQRQDIAKEFKTLYGKDLVKDLKSETSGKFEDLLVALMTPLPEFYAKELHHATSGVGTKESTLIEVLCSLNNTELYQIKQAYYAHYKKALEDDLKSDTSGYFKRLLVSLCNGRRDESYHVDHSTAIGDAQALYKAGEARLGTDESAFNAILCSRNFLHLKVVFDEYHKITGHSIEKSIKKEFSGDIEDGLLAIVSCVTNKAAYFAHRLHSSMAGAGTNDRALIRLVVTRCEIDMQDIKREYQAKYGKSLESAIRDDTSGDYKKLLVALVE